MQFSGMCAVTATFKGRIHSIRRNVCARASADANSSREAGRPAFFSSRLRAPMLTFLVCRRVDIGHRMPLLEMEAIVLRTYRLGEADKIASLFTRQLGRLRAVARGAQRPKSRYGGTLEPLSHLRLWIFERENRDLLQLNSAELEESFFDMQRDYRVQLAAQFLVEVSERLLPEREVNERAFRLLLAVLRALKHSGEVNRPLLYFDYWILRLGGFLPDLETCTACGQVLGEEGGYYGPGSETLLCRECRGAGASQRVSGAALAMVRAACHAPLDRWLAQEKAPAGCREARRFFEVIIESHAEHKLITREMMEKEV
jgi:DNA repair protein RecO (recombination protein O)